MMVNKRIPVVLLLLAAGAALYVALARPPWLAQLWTDGKPGPLHFSGNIEAHESTLSFKTVQSRLVALPFNEGQWVRKGAVLAEVDGADYQQQLAIAQANVMLQQRQADAARQSLYTTGRTLLVDQAELKQRQLDLQRAVELQQQGFTSTASVDQARTALQQAGAVLERDQSLQQVAARNLEVSRAGVHSSEETGALARIVASYTTLTAPFDGVVLTRQAELGEIVVPGTPVITLADLDHVWLRAYLNETDLGRVRLGQAVTVCTDSHPGKNYAGRVSFIADKAEFTPKSVETHAERVTLVYRVKIDIDNASHELVPGMPADAVVSASNAGK